MQSLIFHILKEPRVYRRVLRELDAAQASGALSPTIQYSEAMQLPYFQAALKEAMRVRPAVGLNITRHVPPGGVEVDGTRYPGGTIVALNGWVLHRDRAVFGEDADVYRPERWLEGVEETALKQMDKFMYQVRERFCSTRMPKPLRTNTATHGNFEPRAGFPSPPLLTDLLHSL